MSYRTEEVSEHTPAALRLLQRAEAAEARCARLESALRQISKCKPPPEERRQMQDAWEVDEWIAAMSQRIALAALSDTAQEPMTVGDGGTALFTKIAEDASEKMRERAAAQADAENEPELAAAIRALPLLSDQEDA